MVVTHQRDARARSRTSGSRKALTKKKSATRRIGKTTMMKIGEIEPRAEEKIGRAHV